jgi:basic membrane lipoprotein Med (substrate-binding protein (PBP1-ABC) superfamily)
MQTTAHRFTLSGLLAASAWLSVALPQSAAAQDFALVGKPKVAMLYAFPLKEDEGWSQSFEDARLRLEKTLGAPIARLDNIVQEPAPVKAAVEQLVKSGVNIIIGGAFGYSETFKELAEQYPNVAFLNGAGTTNGRNLQAFYGRTYESQYLCGMAAASVAKTGKLGFVAANPYGVVNWTVNAFAMGAQKVNPAATVTVIYTGAWNDPLKERAAANALADQGIEVIGQHVDTATPQRVAQERGIYGTGNHIDLSKFAPKATICSSMAGWDKFLAPEIKKIVSGKWKPAQYGAFITLKDGGDDISPLGSVLSKAQVGAIMAEREAILKGKQIYAGPLKDRTGRERVAAGQVITDAALWKMDWLVKGVVVQK